MDYWALAEAIPRISRPVRSQSRDCIGLKQVKNCDILLYSKTGPKSDRLIKNELKSFEMYSLISKEATWTVGSKMEKDMGN